MHIFYIPWDIFASYEESQQNTPSMCCSFGPTTAHQSNSLSNPEIHGDYY